MKTFLNIRQYLTEIFLEWEIFRTNLTEKTKPAFCVQQFISKNRKRKRDRANQATDGNAIGRMRFT